MPRLNASAPARKPRRPRRKAPPPRFARWVKPGAVGLAALALLGGATWLWTSGAVARGAAWVADSTLRATAEAGLRVESVLLVGRANADKDSIFAALEVERGTPILSFDPAEAQARIERLSWVRRAVVERRLPQTILITIDERRPLALWQNDGRMVLVDADGVALTERDLGRFGDLPLVVGDDAAEHAPQILALLAGQPALEARVEAAVRVGGRRWDLRLKNGIDVRLPEHDVAAALDRLARVEAAGGVLERDVVLVDLRMPDRLIVRQSPAAAARGRAPGQKT